MAWHLQCRTIRPVLGGNNCVRSRHKLLCGVHDDNVLSTTFIGATASNKYRLGFLLMRIPLRCVEHFENSYENVSFWLVVWNMLKTTRVNRFNMEQYKQANTFFSADYKRPNSSPGASWITLIGRRDYIINYMENWKTFVGLDNTILWRYRWDSTRKFPYSCRYTDVVVVAWSLSVEPRTFGNPVYYLGEIEFRPITNRTMDRSISYRSSWITVKTVIHTYMNIIYSKTEHVSDMD